VKKRHVGVARIRCTGGSATILVVHPVNLRVAGLKHASVFGFVVGDSALARWRTAATGGDISGHLRRWSYGDMRCLKNRKSDVGGRLRGGKRRDEGGQTQERKIKEGLHIAVSSHCRLLRNKRSESVWVESVGGIANEWMELKEEGERE
jgi:hypothetical protein